LLRLALLIAQTEKTEMDRSVFGPDRRPKLL
jgi:hypothetical protein